LFDIAVEERKPYDALLRRIYVLTIDLKILVRGLTCVAGQRALGDSPCLSNIFLHHVLDERFENADARQLSRREVLAYFAKPPPYIVAMEACGRAHYWAPEIAKLEH
jgi:hypothetical protein